MTSSSNKKTLVRNTVSMYVRMLFLMLISFYTSRVVLQSLGADDFGTYNVVGGVVVMFTFVNTAMTTGTQRHFSYELGKSHGNVARIFSACLNIHLCISVLIVLLAETVGLWFVNTKLNFPEGRLGAVNWVYQFSIMACVFNIIRVPYNALVIAYEKMSFYAYIGIVEGLFKLAIVYLLVLSPIDKLISYSALITLVIVLVTVFYYLYCKHSFRDTEYIMVNDKALYKKLLTFSGWTLFGSIANMVRNQGLSFLVNIFYGVGLNAAIGIATQVCGGVTQFVGGFQQAFNPQLTKAEASSNKNYQINLISSTAKFSYLVILFCTIPILYNLNYLLTIWLGTYPPYTLELCTWIIIAVLIDSISGPLWVTIFATGKIKVYQINISLLLLLNLPLAFFCGVMDWQPQYVFTFQAILNFLAIIVRLICLKKITDFNIIRFIRRVFVPLTWVTLLMLPVIIAFLKYWLPADNIVTFLLQSFTLVAYETIVILMIGLSKRERETIFNFIRNKYS